MKQIVQSASTGVLSVRAVPAPRVKPGHLLVRTVASLISAGTERMVVEFAKRSLLGKATSRPDLVKQVMAKIHRDGLVATLDTVRARLDQPLPLGYSASGVVVEVGHGLEGKFQVGDNVAIAGAGIANHAEYNVAPGNLAAAVPEDVSHFEACFGTLASIALNGIRLLEPKLGDVVGVIGVGLVGQLAAQLLAIHGCRVLCLDYSAQRLALARSLGAEFTWNLADGSPSAFVGSQTNGVGCDGVVITAATCSSEPFDTAADIARDRAKISLVGVTGTEFPYREFMKKELSVVVSRSYGPGRYDNDFEKRNIKYPVGWVRWTEADNLAECVRLMSPNRTLRLTPTALTTHRFPINDAEKAYELVTEGMEPHLGVVIEYPTDQQGSVEPIPAIEIRPYVIPHRGRCTLGVIGAGSFARSKLLPILARHPQVVLHTVVTQRGVSADDTQRRFGFRHCGTDESSVFDDPQINAVVITTPHSTHATFTARALSAGKAVLVEKPLALTRDELNSVVRARNTSSAFFQVGFNRRFAPMIVSLCRHLAPLPAPKNVLMRINAGQLAADSWQREPDEGNGRIIGELCHFVDLARCLIAVPIVAVRADAARLVNSLCEDVTVAIRFSDGSLCTLVYTALGDPAYSKERIECYAGGTVATIDNFRTLEIVVNGSVRRQSSRLKQDKGHHGELDAFVAAVVEDTGAPIPEPEIVETSVATIAILEALRTGSVVLL
ncbi:bi-domain-containing oxidoreductase [Bradyrhizobium sp. ARR65]|uniref:Gfo/Idh/MocA family oxidoreductase n=1 Tax=Bradyrhizobium sp. ARR65 TaxID=1040989 RepID=UPI000467C0D2|nr:bi-domain-containing oxidoreductase [Bradyrhizobium sp. ARR65]